MQLVYNSDGYAVMQFTPQPEADAAEPTAAHTSAHQGGFEIVDKLTRKEIYLQGAVAESFQAGVKALVDQGKDPAALEDYIACYTVLAQQPVLLH